MQSRSRLSPAHGTRRIPCSQFNWKEPISKSGKISTLRSCSSDCPIDDACFGPTQFVSPAWANAFKLAVEGLHSVGAMPGGPSNEAYNAYEEAIIQVLATPSLNALEAEYGRFITVYSHFAVVRAMRGIFRGCGGGQGCHVATHMDGATVPQTRATPDFRRPSNTPLTSQI